MKEYGTQVLFERNTETSDVCLTWYNIVDNQKIFRIKTCEERMSLDEFRKFKNMMRCYNTLVEE
jgi:hypothetical protein